VIGEIETRDATVHIPTAYGFSIYDALIVAVALQARCTTLYSEDLQHGQRIAALTVRNPFGE
jgi:predicted nucleic acid-binding protein